MKTISSLVILAFIFVSQIAKSQTDPKVYVFKDFDKVKVENINGTVEIVLGKSYKITVSGQGNASEQVQVIKSKDQLLLQLAPQFVADWKSRKVVNVRIEMPEVSKLTNLSNADVSVENFTGRYFGIENRGNGNVNVAGSIVDWIEITNNGNGNVETKTITSKKAEISKSGNGDVNLRTNRSNSM